MVNLVNPCFCNFMVAIWRFPCLPNVGGEIRQFCCLLGTGDAYPQRG